MLLVDVIVWLCIATLTSANTEAFYFQIPNDHIHSKVDYPIVTIDEINDISIVVPSPKSQNHLVKWFKIDDSIDVGTYNARISWSALDPVDLIHFDFETEDHEGNKGLFFYLEVKYDCYTTDQEFMSTDHQIDMKIYVSSTICFIPVDLLPNIGLITSFIIVGYSIHGYIYNFLKSLI